MSIINCPHCGGEIVHGVRPGKCPTVWVSPLIHDLFKAQAKLECLSVSHLLRKAISELPEGVRLEKTPNGGKTISVHVKADDYDELVMLAEKNGLGVSATIRAVIIFYLARNSPPF